MLDSKELFEEQIFKAAVACAKRMEDIDNDALISLFNEIDTMEFKKIVENDKLKTIENDYKD